MIDLILYILCTAAGLLAIAAIGAWIFSRDDEQDNKGKREWWG